MREEKGGNQPRREKHALPLRNLKSCIPPFLLVVQHTCKAKLFFLVARTRKPSDFKNCEIYFTFLFSLYDEYEFSPMLIFSMIVYFNC
jgi:hypothetical protein